MTLLEQCQIWHTHDQHQKIFDAIEALPPEERTADTDMDQRAYQLMRGRSVREVDSTNGRITFKEVLDFQRSV